MTNRTQFILNKKGAIEFVFSKLAFMIFGILIISALFFFVGVQKDIQGLNKLAQTAKGISTVVSTVSSSPFNTSTEFNLDFEGELKVANQSFELYQNENKIKTSFNIPTNFYENLTVDNCLHIEKQESTTVIESCQ